MTNTIYPGQIHIHEILIPPIHLLYTYCILVCMFSIFPHHRFHVVSSSVSCQPSAYCIRISLGLIPSSRMYVFTGVAIFPL